MSTKRIIPLVFMALSVLYLVFALTLKERHMIGDVRGWDPGSRFLPVGVGALGLAVSAYLFVRELLKAGGRRRKGGAPAPPRAPSTPRPGTLRPGGPPAAPAAEPVRPAAGLVVFAVAATLLYIATFRLLGFILGTNLLLFLLVYFSFRREVRLEMALPAAWGAAASSAFVLVLYSLGRLVTRSMVLYGKRADLELLTNKPLTAAAALLAAGVPYLLVLLLTRKAGRREAARHWRTAFLTAPAVTEIFYLVFRQVFLVSLARGLSAW